MSRRKRPDLALRNTVHGLSRGPDGKRTRLYGIWVRMRQRCRDPRSSDYHLYGGRGITVCPEWDDFAAFHAWALANGYRDDLTLDRIDNDGPYSPENCRWVPAAAQARNTRRNRLITFRGQTKTLAEWSRILGMEHSLLRYRLDRWGDVDRAFTRPVRGRKHALAQARAS